MGGVPPREAVRAGLRALSPTQGRIDQVKRVSAAGGARPPGRRPRRTRSVGGLASLASLSRAPRQALAVPPRGQPDDEQAGVAARLEHALLAGRCQQRLGRDAEDALDGERAVREEAARIALALLRHCGGACEPERRLVGPREPGAELDRRPVVLGPAERDEHGALRRRVPRNEQRHVAGRFREDGGELLVGSSLGEELVGASASRSVDVELGCEPSQVLRRALST